MGNPQPKRADKSYSTYNLKMKNDDFRECLKYILNLPANNNNSVLCNFMNECSFYEDCNNANKIKPSQHFICEKQRLFDFGCDLHKYLMEFSRDGYIINEMKWQAYELKVVYPAIRHIIGMYYNETMVNDFRPSPNKPSEKSDVYRELISLKSINRLFSYEAFTSVKELIEIDFRSLLKPEKDGGWFRNTDSYKEMFYRRALLVLREKFELKDQNGYDFNWNYYFLRSYPLSKKKSFHVHLRNDIDQHVYGAKMSLLQKDDDVIPSLKMHINTLQSSLDQYDYDKSLKAIRSIYSLCGEKKISPIFEEYFYLFELFCLLKLGFKEKDNERIKYLSNTLIQEEIVKSETIHKLKIDLYNKDRRSIRSLLGFKVVRYVLELEKMGVENVLDIKQPVFWAISLNYRSAGVDPTVIPFRKRQKRD